jgi:hypothetical protein
MQSKYQEMIQAALDASQEQAQRQQSEMNRYASDAQPTGMSAGSAAEDILSEHSSSSASGASSPYGGTPDKNPSPTSRYGGYQKGQRG